MYINAIAVALLLAVRGHCRAGKERISDTPIRIVVGFTPGGQPTFFSVDQRQLGEALRQTVVVDNRPVPAGIGTKIVADATPTGHAVVCVGFARHLTGCRKLITIRSGIFRHYAMYNASYCWLQRRGWRKKCQGSDRMVKPAWRAEFQFGRCRSGTHFAGEVFKDARKSTS